MTTRNSAIRTLTAFTGVMMLAIPLTASSITGGEDEATLAAIAESGPSPDYVYRNYTDIKELLLAAETQYPEIAKVYDIGDGWEKTEGLADRDILAMKISDNVATDEDEPEVLIMALHHAREWPTVEIAAQLIENLTKPYGIDSRVSWLVDNRETWIVPVVNPDGLDFALADPDNEGWRKNRRDNGDGTYGVDLNRNYNGSQNGDPLGEWGGAGTSSDTSSDLYCGVYPFSEPETQAIRDLVLNHSFVAAIDFHTYSDLVMWPWGYTANTTADDADLVRIGNELAYLNGYVAEQSIGLYPTTGDSIDWLYGAADVFAFLFEVGGNPDGFHPSDEDTVIDQIAENIPPALLLIEIAGDRQERQFDIVHHPPSALLSQSEPWVVEAEITAARGVASSELAVVYRVDEGSWTEVTMQKVLGNDTYAAEIPGQPGGSGVDYYISAFDEGGVGLTSPRYAPYELHAYAVTGDDEDPVANAGDDFAVQVGMPATFTGAASSDNVGVTNYTWSFEYESTPVAVYGESPSFTFWAEGEYSVTLTVRDDAGNSDTDTVVVTVTADAIPEFGHAIVPIAALLVVFILLAGRRRGNGKA